MSEAQPSAVGGTKSHRIYLLLKDAILSGRLPAGSKLPGENKLAEQHGVSRSHRSSNQASQQVSQQSGQLRQQLKDSSIVVAPGVFDALGASLAEQAGATTMALCLTGDGDRLSIEWFVWLGN